MKKLIITIIMSLMIMVPTLIFADEISDQTNELGVKKGTEVHGEDISELSEKELQYVPKDWRDGDVEPEHRKGKENHKSSLMRKRYPDVNRYIKEHYGRAVKVEQSYKKEFEQFNYRNGYGAVEGVVAHETANDFSTIDSEIAYMRKNHNNAFVHAFVDHNNIIEIHPLDFGAWGAGRFANERFAHVELVRVNSFSQFAKSINNYSDYLATILYEYGLGVSSAEEDGKGSLWSHQAVSNHLGGTTHTDPHGYFARYGYEWKDFVDLVTQKYNEKVKKAPKNTSKLGHIKSGKVKIYDTPLNTGQSVKAGSRHTNEVYYIKSEVVHKNKRYYLISDKPSSHKGTIGWVQAKNMNTHIHKGIDKKDKTFKIKGTGKAYDKAWGGSKNLIYDLSDLEGKAFYVNLSESVGKNQWYRGTIEDTYETVWIHSSYLSKGSKTSKLGHIKHSDVNIYQKPWDSSSHEKAGSDLTNAVYYIKKQTNAGKQTYYYLSNQPSSHKGTVGWVKQEDMSIHKHTSVDKKDKSLYIKGTGKSYTKAWGGNKDLVYKNMDTYAGSRFQVDLTEKVGSNLWYRGKLNGKTIWLHESNVINEINVERTSKLGHLRNKANTIYETLGDTSSAINANNYKDAVYYIKKQAKINNDLYFKISQKPSSTKGVVGWVKASDMSTHSHVGKDKKIKTLYIKGSGKAFTKAWGGSKDEVYDLSNYENRTFEVNLTEKVSNNVWYRGNLDGNTVWAHESNTQKEMPIQTSKTSKLGHLLGKTDAIYETLGDASSAIDADSYKDAVYYIKEQANMEGNRYYKISHKPSSTKGVVGWVRASYMSTHSHVSKDKKNKTFLIKGTGNAFSKAWGGSKDKVYDMKDFEGRTFKVHLTEKVGKNVWYRGNLDGHVVWLHNSYLK